MPFVKRRFGPGEYPVDLRLLGIEQRRLPKTAWDWVVDDSRSAVFTQLISDTGEMRDGDYWYVLVASGSVAVVHITQGAGRIVDGQLRLHARFTRLPTPTTDPQRSELRALAHEAMTVISVQSDGLVFPEEVR